MNDQNFKNKIYETYVSDFTQTAVRRSGYGFSDSKLLPLLRPWIGHLDRHAPCLDLGCGNGNVLHALATLGFQHREGIDLSDEQVVIALEVCERVICGDILAYMRDAKPNHYGLITLFDVIEHLPKPEILALLGNIARALRPGGVFIAHCPNGNSPFALRVFAADLTHETLLNETSARHLCVLSGLDHFGAAEHLGASRSLSGRLRQAAWSVMRTGIRVLNGVETGSLGSKVLTRNFAFKAEKPLAVKASKK